ncbi:MAG: hypothetical protein D5S00_04020 [Tindallia sp. MSAO_Bac2]|nr:MAG: hypothetical protein D5S00_04020 [Tindallia sp. MSAO_Bac2]
MRVVAKDRFISCQIQYVPLKTLETDNDVQQVLEIISNSGLEYQVGSMTTQIRGKAEEVFGLLQLIEKKMTENNRRFTMNTIISNDCGCHQ